MNRLIAASLSLSLALAADLAAQAPFSVSRTALLPPVAGRLDDITAGDIDGDGDLDLVIANDHSPSTVLINDGNGNFTNGTAGRLTTPLAHATYEADLADIDGDGDLDLLMVDDDWLPNQVHRNNGAGVFTDVSTTALPANADYSTDQVVADFDGDGDVDWFVGNSTAPSSKLYLNNGSGVFTDGTAGRLPGTCFADRRSFAADLDGDGDLDLVLNTGGNYLSGPPTVLRNSGTAVFTPVALGLGNGLCYAADVDGDGRLDLIDDNGRRVNRNLGNFMFAAPVAIAGATSGTFVALDQDGDGDVDLVGVAGLFVNGGAGTFTLVANTLLSSYHWAANTLAADLDGDDDLVSTACIQLGGALLDFRRQVHAPSAPRPGAAYLLELHADHVGSTTFLQPALALGAAAIPLPPLGTLRLDPASIVMLPWVQASTRVTTLPLQIPNMPRLVGTSLYFQAVYASTGRPTQLSNALRDVIVP